MEEYRIMEHLEMTVTRRKWWTGNRKIIWSGLIANYAQEFYSEHTAVNETREVAYTCRYTSGHLIPTSVMGINVQVHDL